MLSLFLPVLLLRDTLALSGRGGGGIALLGRGERGGNIALLGSGERGGSTAFLGRGEGGGAGASCLVTRILLVSEISAWFRLEGPISSGDLNITALLGRDSEDIPASTPSFLDELFIRNDTVTSCSFGEDFEIEPGEESLPGGDSDPLRFLNGGVGF